MWRGHERVLDVGTGAGLLAIGAAKRVPQGHVVGIDIWRRADLSGNSRDRVFRNAAREGVADRVEVVEADARSMPFELATFDVVVSMLCLHNIDRGRNDALGEIVPVLKPGGSILISDFADTREASAFLASAGLDVEHGPIEWGTFPFQRVVVARKPS